MTRSIRRKGTAWTGVGRPEEGRFCCSLLLIKLAHCPVTRTLAVNSGSANSLQCGIWWRGIKPPWFPLYLNKREKWISEVVMSRPRPENVHVHPPKCHSWSGIAMEMCDTLVDKLSGWASSSPAWAFERFDSLFLSLGFVQAVVYLGPCWLFFCFTLWWIFVQCVV